MGKWRKKVIREEGRGRERGTIQCAIGVLKIRWCAENVLVHRNLKRKIWGSIRILKVRDREGRRWIKKGIFGYIKNVNKKKNSCDSL